MLSANPEITEKLLPVFPADGQGITDNHSDLRINKSDISDTNNVSLMYAYEDVRG
jgi:hypothetical protein